MRKIQEINIKRLLFFVLIIFLAINQSAQGKEFSRAGAIKDINILFLKGNYASVIKTAENTLKKHKFSRTEKKEILYIAGLSYIKTNDFRKAHKAFRVILNMKGAEFRENAYIGIADSYFHEKKYDEAINAYKSVLSMYPRSERTSGTYYNLGLSYKALNDMNKADSYFNKIKRHFGESLEAGKSGSFPAEQKKIHYYIIQLGAFNSLKNAKKLVRKLQQKGYDSYIQKVKRNRDVLYRVRGGKFSNKSYAMRLLKRLRRSRFHAKIIVE